MTKKLFVTLLFVGVSFFGVSAKAQIQSPFHRFAEMSAFHEERALIMTTFDIDAPFAGAYLAASRLKERSPAPKVQELADTLQSIAILSGAIDREIKTGIIPSFNAEMAEGRATASDELTEWVQAIAAEQLEINALAASTTADLTKRYLLGAAKTCGDPAQRTVDPCIFRIQEALGLTNSFLTLSKHLQDASKKSLRVLSARGFHLD